MVILKPTSKTLSLNQVISQVLRPSPLVWPASVSTLSSASGVYWFQDENHKLLYLGKAKRLKSRLASYTRPQLSPKNSLMLSKAKFYASLDLNSELQALIFEAALIKHFQPPYNIELKDDKSPLYIGITAGPSPRVLTLHLESTKAQKLRSVFGPFLPSRDARNLLRHLRPIFPYCQETQKKSGNRPCFYYHLHLCPGICCGQISEKAYLKNILLLERVLQGDFSQLQKDLSRKIRVASQNEKYELAADYKNTLTQLQLLEAHYHLNIDESDTPLRSPALGLTALTKLLNPYFLSVDFTRLEAYDISNLMGQNATASMVVFMAGESHPEFYRHFHIKTLTSPNDPGMLAEVIKRRQKHLDWPLPGLIILDGGRSQLAVVSRLLPLTQPLVGIAKHPDHLVIRDSQGKISSLSLDPASPATRLLQQMRDEAHRFSRRLHHHTVLKKFL